MLHLSRDAFTVGYKRSKGISRNPCGFFLSSMEISHRGFLCLAERMNALQENAKQHTATRPTFSAVNNKYSARITPLSPNSLRAFLCPCENISEKVLAPVGNLVDNLTHEQHAIPLFHRR